jgi:hypothetical protein
MGQNGVPGRAGVPGQPGHMGLPGKKLSQKKNGGENFQCFSVSVFQPAIASLTSILQIWAIRYKDARACLRSVK